MLIFWLEFSCRPTAWLPILYTYVQFVLAWKSWHPENSGLLKILLVVLSQTLFTSFHSPNQGTNCTQILNYFCQGGNVFAGFYARKQNASRVFAIVWASVCLSVTLVSCIKTVQARITKSSLLAAPRSLVYRDKISCHWVQGFPSNEGVKEGYPLKKTSFSRYWLE